MQNPTPPTTRDPLLRTLASTPAVALFGLGLALLTGTILAARLEAPDVEANSRGPAPPYREREVSFQSGDVTIAGTLTIPEGEGPFPAVVFLSGAGAQDRDSEFFGNPRGVIKADFLARSGIAVLRTDDRGTGGSTGDTPSATIADLAGDAWEAVRFLRSQPEIDPDRVGLKGSSQGSLVAPLAAVEHPEVAFVVLLSAIGVRGRELWIEQQIDVALGAGMAETAVPRVEELFREALAALDAEISDDERRVRLRRIVHDLDTLLPSSGFAPVAGSAEIRVAALLSPAMRDTLDLDPRPTLERLVVPTLVVHGERDFQVAPAVNLAAIRESLEAAGNPDFEIHLLPGLNHFLQPAATGHPSEYPTIEVGISPQVLEIIAGWIGERFGEPPRGPG